MKRRMFFDLQKKQSAPIAIEEKSSPKKQKNPPVPTQSSSREDSFIVPMIRHPWRPAVEKLFVLFLMGTLVVTVFNVIRISYRGADLKETVTVSVTQGYRKLVSGGEYFQEKNFSKAISAFKDAEKEFKKADDELWFLRRGGQNAVSSSKVLETAQSVIALGSHLAQSSILFTQFTERSSNLPTLFLQANDQSTAPTLSDSTRERPSLTEKLKTTLPLLESSLTELQKAREPLNAISETLVPGDLRDEFRFARSIFNETSEKLRHFEEDIPAVLKLLGDELPHRYLVLLQNNNELRPTGGFIGSYLLVDVNDGYITQTSVHDVYDTDYQLKEVLPPPEDIAHISNRWFLRDSNYSPHFPESAGKATWFLEKSKGPGVDTVIAITENVLEDLLEVTGPVNLPGFSQKISRENFNTIFSYIIESKLSGAEDPKRILKKFVPLFEKELLGKADFTKLGSVIAKNIKEKHLMMFSKETDIQNFFVRMGIDGSVKNIEKNEDYLQVIHTNIGGNKSDRYIEETIRHDTFMDENGELVNEVTVEKLHRWNLKAEQEWYEVIRSFGFETITEPVKEVLGRGKNVTVTKVYVPAGSTLISIDDTPILDFVEPPVKTKEDPITGKTYFMFTMETEHGMKTKRTIRYSLPFELKFSPIDTYRLTVQKQMGSRHTQLIKRVFPDYRMKNIKFSPTNSFLDKDGVLNFSTNLKSDLHLASLWSK